MRVNFYATLRPIVGGKTVEFPLPEGATVSQLVDLVVTTFPALRHELLDENGQLYGHVHVFINGRDAPLLEHALDSVLHPEDVISIFPAVGGGNGTGSLKI